MTSLDGRKEPTAFVAAFLLFAAALLVVGPAEASRTTTDASSAIASLSVATLAPPSSLEHASLELPPLELVEPTAPVESTPRFGFGEDLGLLDPEAGPGGFVLFARGTSRCELTYARNNPLKYVDPDGKDAILYVRHSSKGLNTNFGHTALRVVGNGYDRTYDFGRYGWVSPMKAIGEGILFVWTNPEKFEAKQRAGGDFKGATIQTTDKQDKAVMEYFDEKIKAGWVRSTDSDKTQVKLSEAYTLSGNNCTTISIEALEAAEKATGQPIPGLDEIKGTISPDKLYRRIDDVFPRVEKR